MSVKERLHSVVEVLPDERAEQLLRQLLLPPVLANAPLDDEPVTEQDLAAIARGKADMAAGRLVSHEEVKREFGL
jgi:predicted transcriptional regulator